MKITTINFLSSTVLRHAGLSAALLCGAIGIPAQAIAQDMSGGSDEASASEPAADIVVTGSRIVRDGYNAPTPTTVLGQDLIDIKSPTQVIDALTTMPAFRGMATASTVGVANSGTAGQNFVNLRGMGANRTLVLLDGQRFVPSNATGTVDVGLMPSMLIQRIDVVTGGASAAYGSDAVTGVVNFILNNRLTGLKANVEAGITQYGDNATYKAGLAWGTKLGDRAHLVVSGEYVRSDGIDPQSRPNLKYQYGLVTNPAWTATNGQVRRLILPYVYLNNVAHGGVITTGPLKGVEFGRDGAIETYPTGQYAGSTTMVLPGLDTSQPWSNDLATPVIPVEALSLYSRLSWDVADGTELYVSGNYAENNPGAFMSTPANTNVTGVFTIARTNAFLPQEIADRMDALSLSSITVGRYSTDWGNSRISRNNATYRIVAGLRSEIAPGWELNAYGQYGRNKNVFKIANNTIKARMFAAADVIRDPADSTKFICREKLTNPGSACVPLDIFGVGAASQQAIDYIYGTSVAELEYTQKVVAADLSGEPFSTWAGPVSVAFGAEYREESLIQTVDALSAASAFAIGNPKPQAGKIKVAEGFIETIIPLAKDTAFFKNLDINAALRHTHYDTSGSVQTWKLGLNWEPTDGIRFRATRSRDIRAPNITELLTAPVQQTATLTDPFTNTRPQIQTYSVGNINLKPEKADTTAVGVVLQPGFAPGFSASLDYYNIEIAGAIATLSLQDLLDRCYAGNADLCALVTRESGVITSITNPYLNLNSIKTDGIDFEASYRTDLGDGSLTLRLLANRVFSLKTNDGITSIDRAGDILEGQPKLSGNLIASYSTDLYQFDLDANYIGSGKYNNTFVLPTDINDNDIPDRAYLNSQITFKLGSGSTKRNIYLRVSNITNSKPPAIFTFAGGASYDRVGRAFKAGVRFEY